MSVYSRKVSGNGTEKDFQLNKIVVSIWDNRWLEIFFRWTIGMTFAYASLHKVTDPAQFAEVVCGYLLFPDDSVNLIAIIVPFLELVTGVALILGVYPRSAALLSNIMLLAFIAVLGINLIRGVTFDCGCTSFGKTERDLVAFSIGRNMILLVLGFHVLLFRKTRQWCARQTGSLFKNI